MEYIRENLASNLLALRISKRLKQKETAELIGVSYMGYTRWEKGINWPDPESLEKIASFYGIRSTRLFYDPNLDLSVIPKEKKLSFDEKLDKLGPSTRSYIESLVDGMLASPTGKI